jgi:polyhydroxybutyrate depolymerase
MSLQHQIYFHGPIERHYLLYLPVNYDPLKRIPLLLALHGGGGDARGMLRITQDGFNRLADENNFMVIYPDGFRRQWNDGRPIGRRQDVNDVGFLGSLIDLIANSYSVDRKRVYVTGISNGGFMAYRLACDLPGLIAGIAPVAALMPFDLKPTQPVATLIIAGTDDPLIPYNGGEVTVGMLRRGRVLSGEATMAVWAKANRCEGEPITTTLVDGDPHEAGRVRQTAWSGCGIPIVLDTVEGGGHTWPGGWQYLSEQMVGKTSRNFDANREIWQFFRSLTEG